MKEFLKFTFIEPFNDGIAGIFLALFMWALLLFLSGLLIFGMLLVIDCTYRPINEGNGTVTSKEFIPEHTETIWVYNSALKMSTPQTNYHSDKWKLCIEVDNLRDDVFVSENYFNTIKQGQRLRLKYSFGRIWKTLYIKEIEH